MNKNQKIKFKGIINLKDLASVFVKKKWIFTGFFLLTLIAGLLMTFLKIPVYESISAIKFGDVYYEENLYKYYPTEAESLGIFAPGMDLYEVESSNLSEASSTLRGDELLDDVFDMININIEKEELRETLRTFIDRGNKVIKVVITYSDADDAFSINQTYINEYLLDYRESRSVILEELVQNIDQEILDLESEIEANNRSASESVKEIIIDLEKIKYNLESNQELYIYNVEIAQEASIPAEPINADYLKNVIIVLFASLVVGLIAVYMPSIFTSLKDQ